MQRTVHQGRGNGGIHAARKGADSVSGSYDLPHIGDGGIDEVLRGPGWLGAANDQRKVTQDLGSGLSVVHFRMELHCPHLPLGSLDRCHGSR